MGNYQMAGLEYIFTPQRNMAFFASPFQLKQLSCTKVIFTDITYTGSKDFPYLLNMVAFNEDSLQCKSIFKFSFLYALLKPLVYFLTRAKGKQIQDY